MPESMGVLWLIAIIGFAVLEASTAQFVSIWFAGGALCSLIAFLLGADARWQMLVFGVASGLLLIFTRPIVKRLTKNTDSKTNLDAVIGKKAVVTKETDGFGDFGEAKLEGKLWTVKSLDESVLAEGDVVFVEKVEGVKLVVRK